MRFLFALFVLAAALAFDSQPAAAFCLDTSDEPVTVSGTVSDIQRPDQGRSYYFRITGPSCATTKSEVVGVFGKGEPPCPDGSPVTVTGNLTHVISGGALFAFRTPMNFMKPESVVCK